MSTNYAPAFDDAFNIIRSLSGQEIALELTQTYHGIVLNQLVSLLEVKPDCATFQATKLKMCAILEGFVHLNSHFLPRPVVARLESLNVSKGMFVLSNFAYSEAEWKERQYERVRPKDPTYVSVRCKGKALRAPLVDISLNGMGILASKGKIDREVKIRPASSVRLDFQLPPDYKLTSIRGTVVYTQAVNRSVVKSGLHLYPKAREARSLEKYTAQRKQEIMEAIEQAYLDLSQPYGPESQYF